MFDVVWEFIKKYWMWGLVFVAYGIAKLLIPVKEDSVEPPTKEQVKIEKVEGKKEPKMGYKHHYLDPRGYIWNPFRWFGD